MGWLLTKIPPTLSNRQLWCGGGGDDEENDNAGGGNGDDEDNDNAGGGCDEDNNNSAGGGDDNNDKNIYQYKITASHLCVINRACNTLFI